MQTTTRQVAVVLLRGLHAHFTQVIADEKSGDLFELLTDLARSREADAARTCVTAEMHKVFLIDLANELMDAIQERTRRR